jgi:predicted dehydrogenase
MEKKIKINNCGAFEMVFKVGIIGAGAIAVESHMPVLKRLKDVEIVAICDNRTEIAKFAASKYVVKNVYNDIDEMLLKEKPDIVNICTPPSTHAILAIKAMNAGSHVLVEKPMATSVQDADAMILASKKNRVRLGVVHQNIFNPVVMEAKKLVTSGVIGDILHIELRTSERVDNELRTNKDHWTHNLPGGIFYETLPHPIYLSQFFLDDLKPTAVMARKLSNRSFMKNDELRVLLEGKNGLGLIIASCNSNVRGDTLDIFGSKMALHADLLGRYIVIYKSRGFSTLSVGLGNLSLSAQLLKVLGATASNFINTARKKSSAHYFVITRFIQSLKDNTEFLLSAERGRDTVYLLDQICEKIQ